MSQTCHSDMLFGKGVLAETIVHFELEAVRKGTNEAWREAYHQTQGLEYLWIVYTNRLRNSGNSSGGLHESMALSNQLLRLMKGMDEHEYRTGEAAQHREAAMRVYQQVTA